MVALDEGDVAPPALRTALIIAGASLATCGPILSILAHAVLDDGERFDVGDRVDLGRGDAVVGPVHEIQYVLETFNFWHNLAGRGGDRSDRPR